MNLHAVEDAIANRLAVMSNPSNLCHCHPVLCGALGKELVCVLARLAIVLHSCLQIF